MFEAFVLICLLNDPIKCNTLEDIEGPYNSRKLCIQRAYQIASELPSYLPMYVAKKYMCIKQVKGIDV